MKILKWYPTYKVLIGDKVSYQSRSIGKHMGCIAVMRATHIRDQNGNVKYPQAEEEIRAFSEVDQLLTAAAPGVISPIAVTQDGDNSTLAAPAHK